MRERIFEIIEASDKDDKWGQAYDWFMIGVILASLLPLTFKRSSTALIAIDYISAEIFMIDYLLRLTVADYKLKQGVISFFKYPFTFMAIVDLLCILPTFLELSAGFRLLKIIRLMRTLRVFRTLKLFRYSKSITIIANVIEHQREPLITVAGMAGAYILICALVAFNIEPETFGNFFDAVYWATISLTTMGYGDIYPVSVLGRFFTMISSFVGIAVVALPAGIITAGYMTELTKTAEARAAQEKK